MNSSTVIQPGLTHLPDNARLWVYASATRLTVDQEQYIAAVLGEFLAQWKAHGSELAAGFAIEHNRFVVIAVNEHAQVATGCSIDSSVHVMKQVEQELGLSLFDRMQIAYRDGEEVVSLPWPSFEEKLTSGHFSAETRIFDTSVTTLGAWQQAGEVPVKNSWINRFLS